MIVKQLMFLSWLGDIDQLSYEFIIDNTRDRNALNS